MVRGGWEELTTRKDQFRARALLLRAFEGSLGGVAAGPGHRTSFADSTAFWIEESTGPLLSGTLPPQRVRLSLANAHRQPSPRIAWSMITSP